MKKEMKRKGFVLSVFSISSVIIVFMRYYSPLRSRASLHYEAQSAQFFFFSTPTIPRNVTFILRTVEGGGGVSMVVVEGGYIFTFQNLSLVLDFFLFLEMFFAKNENVI